MNTRLVNIDSLPETTRENGSKKPSLLNSPRIAIIRLSLPQKIQKILLNVYMLYQNINLAYRYLI